MGAKIEQERVETRQAVVAALLMALTLAAWSGGKYRVLHAFGRGNDGAGVFDEVALDARGDLYGTTSGGGAMATARSSS